MIRMKRKHRQDSIVRVTISHREISQASQILVHNYRWSIVYISCLCVSVRVDALLSAINTKTAVVAVVIVAVAYSKQGYKTSTAHTEEENITPINR